MEKIINAVEALEGFYFYQVEKNPYYLTYSNGVDFYFVFNENKNAVLVNASTLEVFKVQDIIISVLSPYIKTSKDFIQEIEVNNTVDISTLNEISEEEFFRICLLIKEKSSVLNVDFIYNTDKQGAFNYVLFMDNSLEEKELLTPLFFNNNYYQIDDKSLGCYKVIHGEQEAALITCNPFMFGFYNQDKNKNSLLFNAKEHEMVVFNVFAKEFNAKIPEALNKISLAFLDRLNDLSFALSVVIAYFNIQICNHLKQVEFRNKVVVAFELEKKHFNLVQDDFLKFNQLLNQLNKRIFDLDLGVELYHIIRHDLNDVKVIQYVFPKKIELIKIFIEEFIKHYKLNIQLYSDLSFSNEEDNFQMF